MALWIIVFVVVTPMVVVRLMPSDPAQWHKQAEPAGLETQKLPNGYIWRQAIEDNGTETMRALDAVARTTLRTKHLAGAIEEGQVTYITRSLVFGFPDYTTIGVYNTGDGQRYIEVYARQRFGKLDLGVNAKRVKIWLAAIKS